MAGPDTEAGVAVGLGRSGVRISPVGAGAMTWGDRWGGYYGGGYAAEDAQAAFRICLAGGVTFFDTAEA
jgi:aryl-alcohol dehydrogenase-like predicted oxidoreductase